MIYMPSNLLKFALVSLTIVLNGCLQGSGLLTQAGGAANVFVDAVEDEEGITSGEFKAGSTVAQKLSASTSGDIAGSSINFPAGALQIDSVISIEQGATIAGSSAASNLGLGSNLLSAKGPSVVVSSSKKVDASKPFTLEIPMTSASLSLASETDRLIVVYKVEKASENELYLGIITRDKITIKNGFLSFETIHFGSFQAAVSDEKIEKKVEVVSTTPILTAATEKKLDPIVWTMLPPVIKADREVAFKLRVTGLKKLVFCQAFVHENKNAAPIEQDSSDEVEKLAALRIGQEAYHYNPKIAAAHTVFARFECTDEKGRMDKSPWSAGAVVPAGSNNPPGLLFTGSAAPNSPVSARIFSDVNPPKRTLTGICNPSKGMVYIDGDVYSNGVSTTCSGAGIFSFTVGFHQEVTGSTTNFWDGIGPKMVTVSQNNGGMTATIIYKIHNSSPPTIISNHTGLTAINVDLTGYYILGNDIGMPNSSSWSPIGTSGQFTGIFSGDFKRISGLQISSGYSKLGLFAEVGSGAYIGHLTLENPSIIVGDTGINKVGALVGYVNCDNDCQITNINVIAKTAGVAKVVANASGNSNEIGGVIGHNYKGNVFSLSSNLMVDASTNGNKIGGLIGWNEGSLKYSSFAGAVKGFSMVGGLVGSSSSVESEIFRSKVEVGASVTGVNYVGGAVGKHEGSAVINQTKSHANVIGFDNPTRLGGLVGGLYSNVLDSYATGDVGSGSITEYAGGLVGEALSGSSIIRSYSTGTVSCLKYCGGLVGATSSLPAVMHSFSVSNVTATTLSGGFIGQNNDGSNADLTNNYFNAAETYCYDTTVSEECAAVSLDAPNPLFPSSHSVYFSWSSTDWVFPGNSYPILPF